MIDFEPSPPAPLFNLISLVCWLGAIGSGCIAMGIPYIPSVDLGPLSPYLLPFFLFLGLLSAAIALGGRERWRPVSILALILNLTTVVLAVVVKLLILASIRGH